MKRAMLALLAGYKRWISPALPHACRFTPTCSEYAGEAITRYGVLRGGALSAWRLLRCQPFARAGFDPVPKLSSQFPVLSSQLNRDVGVLGTEN